MAYLNRIGTALPAHDIHHDFIEFARLMLDDPKNALLFERMAARAGIAHRYSHLRAGNIAAGEVDAGGFYTRGAFPTTAARMRHYEPQALALALQAVDSLSLGADAARITHVIVASCTGFSAPGLDLQLTEALGLKRDVERTVVGFMGCSAAVPALRAADHIVRSTPDARVLVVNVELCSLHLQETQDLETALCFMLFADGAAASLVSADNTGIELGDFLSTVIPASADFITWHIGDHGFNMHLSGKVPGRIAQVLRDEHEMLLRGEPTQTYAHWAVHAGGRTVLDAAEMGLHLPPHALRHSRGVLHDCGNMSSATILFVLARMLQSGEPGNGLAMAFGPGMVAETFRFRL